LDRPRPITPEDVAEGFDCGEATLNDWLRRRSLANHASGASRCFVACRDGRIVGYYALSTGAVQRAEASTRAGHGMPDPVPVILLARLAVDVKEQGRHLGSHLLRDAIARTVAAAEIVGVRAVLVHALHEQAREFYQHLGFEPSPTHHLHLMLLMKDARAAIRAAEGERPRDRH
jgi:predicted N-acetyltransferase YhbS